MIQLTDLQDNKFLAEVNKISGSNVLECYQCGKCVSTCPVSSYMELPPRKIMQAIKLGLKDKVLSANSSWFCLTCSSCAARCPRQIDIPKVMETVRHIAIDEKIYPESRKINEIRKFHDIFLDMVKRYGRMYEIRLMAEFNIRTGRLFKDMALAPLALGKGKLGLLPEKTRNKAAIKKMFKLLDNKEK